MVQVTLTFHSIAAAIAALSALPAGAAAEIALPPAAGGAGNGKKDNPKTIAAPAAEQPTPAPAASPAAVKEADKAIETAKAGPAAAAKPASSPKPDAEAALDYEKDVKPLALQVAAKGREVLLKAWADLGVANGKELKPEQYATAKAHFEQLLAA